MVDARANQIISIVDNYAYRSMGWGVFTECVRAPARGKPGDKALTTDYWFAYSRDDGQHWHERHLAGPFNLRASRRTGRPQPRQ